MPIENLEEQGLEKNPNLHLAQWKFLLSLPEFRADVGLKQKLMDTIKNDNMAPWYEHICPELNWTVDAELLKKMKENNQTELQTLEAAIEDAEKNLGEMEVREANLKKSEYLCRIGDKVEAETAFRKTYEKTVSLGHRLDIVFHLIRLGLFYLDHDLITRNIEKAKYLIEEGGDWDRRNRLKVKYIFFSFTATMGLIRPIKYCRFTKVSILLPFEILKVLPHFSWILSAHLPLTN